MLVYESCAQKTINGQLFLSCKQCACMQSAYSDMYSNVALVSFRSFHTEKSDGCTSLCSFANQSMGWISLEIRFVCASFSKRRHSRCMKLPLPPLCLPTTYADCAVTAIIEVSFLYFGLENFASVISLFCSLAFEPI